MSLSYLCGSRMKALSIGLALFIMNSCGSYDKYSKDDFLYSEKHNNDIYSEYFRVASYGTGGDVYSVYITDSINFRVHVLLYYDHDYVDFEFSNEEVTVNRLMEKKLPNEEASRIKVEEVKLNIGDLKSKKVWE